MPPKWLENASVLFPAIHFLSLATCLFNFLKTPSLEFALLLVFFVYLSPVLLWRVVRLIFPVETGWTYIGIREKQGNAWILAHRLQYLFITLPVLERVLILIPGAFSMWLRLWGSRIGKGVIWTPGISILDRTHLKIGDYVFFGDKSYLSTHLIRRHRNRIQLLVKEINIGDRSFIGYSTDMGPGTDLPSLSVVPSRSKAALGKVVTGGDR